MSPVALHHQQTGDGPPLLLAGSLGTSLAMWDPQAEALGGSHRVTRFDLRGHGRSPVPDGPYTMDDLGGDVLALMDHLGLERASYCGLSIGGMIGQWLAIHAPDRIDRLVLLCTSAHLPPADVWRDRAETVRAAGTPEAVADGVLGRWFTPQFAGAHGDLVAGFRAMISSTPAEGYAACCEAIAVMDLRPELARITAPTLVVAGAQDPATPPEHGRGIAEGVGDGRLEVLDPGAHLISVERAPEITELIRRHLGGMA